MLLNQPSPSNPRPLLSRRQARRICLLILGGSLGIIGHELASKCTAGLRGPSDDPKLLVDRVWVDSKPEKLTDYVSAAYFSGYSPVGIFQQASAYDFHFEQFEYRRDKSAVKMIFPQTSKRADLTFTIKACDELLPFDLCLDLSDNPWGKPKRFYAMRERDEEESVLGRLSGEVRARGRKR